MKINFEKLNTVAIYAAAISIVILILFASIQLNAFNRDFYKSTYEELKTSKILGMTKKDLNRSTTILLDYLEDNRDDIKLEVVVQGKKMQAFNAKETAHMVDVKNLYQSAIAVAQVAGGIFVLSVGYLFIRLKKGAFTVLSIGYIKVAILAGAFLLMLAGWAYVDFDAFWTAFHEVLFRNDLWLLDPYTDLMINLFPAAFFSKMIFRIVLSFAVCFGVLFTGSYVYLRHELKKLTEEELNYEE